MKIESLKVKHKNIPFFTPHSGCTYDCAFCCQTKITGYSMPQGDMLAEAERLKRTVEDALPHLDGAKALIAFFGGSFTAIEPKRMERLLETAYSYVKSGHVSGIRLSTRPDCIDVNVLDVLSRYGVTDIELGIQSTDNGVLTASGRGHGAEDCFKAARLIKERGFRLTGQMMIGLPCSALDKETQTALDIAEMGADAARIYPTVVFEGTRLHTMTLEGDYKPLSNEEAAGRSAACIRILRDAGLKILRVGLHSSKELKAAPFGPNHPAMGELAYSRLLLEDIRGKIGKAQTAGKTLKIYVPAGLESKAAGINGENKEKLVKEYGFKKVKIYAKSGELSVELR